MARTIEDPDFILEDSKNTNIAAFIRKAEGSNLNVVVKLSVKGNAAGFKNSVSTLYPMSDKRLKRLINRAKVVYKR